MRRGNWISVSLLALGVGAATVHAGAQASASAMPAGGPAGGMDQAKTTSLAAPLKITFGDKSESWSPTTLAALPHTSLTVFNEHVKASQTYSGVPLMTLLTRLGVPDKPHGKDFRLYLLAEGSDGYGVVYSVGEITPDVHEGVVIVADGMGEKPLAESGPLQLVAAGEKRPARWVRNLVAIHVMTAQ